MSPKPKSTASKIDWQITRESYTWYLRPPFDKTFQKTQWWQAGETKQEPKAALYELVRRHPLVGEALRARIPSEADRIAAHWDDPKCPPSLVEGRVEGIIEARIAARHEPPSLSCTCRFALRSWDSLEQVDRTNWSSCIGNVKGLDLRWEEIQCFSVKHYAHWEIIAQRKKALRNSGKYIDPTVFESHESWEAAQMRNRNELHRDMALNPPTVQEWETAIANQAVEAFRRGFELFAFAPDLKRDKASTLLENAYSSAQSKSGKKKQRARWEDWLPIIASFDDSEMNQGAYAQDFARYRRLMGGVRFD